MSDSSMHFHKIWIDQCAATEDIRERFGLADLSIITFPAYGQSHPST
jgi:hypothetical protein